MNERVERTLSILRIINLWISTLRSSDIDEIEENREAVEKHLTDGPIGQQSEILAAIKKIRKIQTNIAIENEILESADAMVDERVNYIQALITMDLMDLV